MPTRKVLRLLAALVVSVPVFLGITPAATAQPPSRLPLTVANDSGRAEQVYLYMLGVDLGSGAFDATYLDGYLTDTWNTYRSTDLTFAPFPFQPNLKYTGRTDSNGVLQFTDATGKRVASFPQPATKDVFGCDGRLAAPNDDVVGPIARTLCASLHRSTTGFLHAQPTFQASDFYTRPVTDHYSRHVHANMVDGKAYGFAFDDVGAFESLVFDGAPTAARITLTSF